MRYFLKSSYSSNSCPYLSKLHDMYFCKGGDGSVSFVKPAAPLPPADHTKSWQQINDKNQGQVAPNPWGTINSAITPWPSLGSVRTRPRNPTNQLSNANQTRDWVRPNSPTNPGTLTPNSGRNVGVDLSYGPNAQNINYGLKPNQNVGVALSYGISSNANVSTQNPVLGRPQAPAPTQSARSSPSLNGAGKDSQLTGASPPTRPTQPGASSSGSGRDGQPAQIPPITQPPTGSSSLKPGQTQTESSQSDDDELREFSEALLKKDTNNAAKYVTINYQGKTTSRSTKDEAPQKWVSSSRRLVVCLTRFSFQVDDYTKRSVRNSQRVQDVVTAQQLHPGHHRQRARDPAGEIRRKLLPRHDLTDASHAARQELLGTERWVWSSSSPRETERVLPGKISKDPNDFKQKLKEIWFNTYSRGGGRIGSSGFEHVFLAEIKKNAVSGLHNWLYFNDAEVKGTANYLGYMHKIDLGNVSAVWNLGVVVWQYQTIF